MSRVLFPATGFTLDDALAYYDRVAGVLLPHLRRRPMSFKRYPSTVRQESFWEKDAPSFTPAWVKTFPVPRREGGDDIHYVLVNDLRTLRWVVGAGGIELHPFLHRVPKIAQPTHVVFDLDPGEGAGTVDCCEVALLLRSALAALQLESLAKVSGSKGLQVYVPLHTAVTHETTELFAQLLAGELARSHPSQIVAKMTKTLRRGKVFIDWSQNAGYKTTVAVYSLRAKREEPYVSMPVSWNEVTRTARDGKAARLEFSPEAALKRIAKSGDLFEPLLKVKQRLPHAAVAIEKQVATPANASRPRASAAIPKPSSQSGRRLFVVTKTEMGNELWLDMRGKFKRWILRPDRNGTNALIALPAGDFAIDPSYYRAEVPAAWCDRVTLEDSGSYEVIDGSYQERMFRLFFNGKVLAGEWELVKIEAGEEHRSWRLTPAR